MALAPWRSIVFSHAHMVLMLCGGLCASRAQSAVPVLAPATLISPLLQQDGTAVFRLAMPNAAKVELNLEGMKAPLPMTKAPDGTWSVTVPKLAPQYYSYSFQVDGTNVLDPRNATFTTGFFEKENTFLVPGNPPMPWQAGNVPHGVVHHHYYPSNSPVLPQYQGHTCKTHKDTIIKTCRHRPGGFFARCQQL